MPEREEKPCTVCGRTIQWRRKWLRDWESVKYCSERCRRAGVGDVDVRLERAFRDLLAARPASASICPSEVARVVGGADEAIWRALMEPARAAARRLVARGEAEITQGGRAVNPSIAKGPIRVRRARG